MGMKKAGRQIKGMGTGPPLGGTLPPPRNWGGKDGRNPMKKTQHKRCKANPEAINAIGPAGETVDRDISRIVSGQPAGGPHDLGKKAHEENPES